MHKNERKIIIDLIVAHCASLSLLGFELGSQARNLEPRGEGRLGELKQTPFFDENIKDIRYPFK